MKKEVDLSKFKFRRPIDVRWGDYDMLRHVNNAVYFSYLENARIHYLQESCKWDWENYKMVIANMSMDFLAPIEMKAKPEALLRCTRIGNKSFNLENVIRDINTGTVYNIAQSVLVAVDGESGKAIHIPEHHASDLRNYDEVD
ncbi:MAG: acyl-CoA thioesterase [Bacteroidota bacterium]